MTNSWRCVLIGSESLLIQCAQTLEQAGHHIIAVVSTAPAIKRWAAERGIRVLENAQAMLSSQDLRPFDYLFSITNLSVLPADVIALPTRAAINFHDGPLPAYAGLNTPVWALLNGETEHGITWHLMTQQVDQGAILAQRRVSLTPQATALTLNTQCFEAGMESFEPLVQGLADGSLQGQPQTEPIAHYYGRKDRPAAACAIDWTQDAARIATLIRALDFGTYANPMGGAKASWSGQPLIVAGVTVLDTSSGTPHGTVVSVEAQGLTVSTGSTDLLLQRLESLDGKVLTALEAASHFGLRAGAAFDPLPSALADRLSTLNTQVAASEGFWQRRLATQTAVELPYIDRSAPVQAPRFEHVDTGVPTAPLGVADRADNLVALTLAYLARLTDKDSFDVGFADPALDTAVQGLQAWFASQVPLRLHLDFAQGAAAVEQTVKTELAELRKRLTYATDLVARAPELRALAQTANPRVLPVAVVLVDSLDACVPQAGSELTIAFNRQGDASRWCFDASKLDIGVITQLQAQWLTLLRAADADPQRHLAELPLLDAAEQTRVLEQWNATEAPWRSDACVHRLIEEQAARTPDQTALVCEDQSLSYGELDRRANQLARRLAALGVGPDVLVGLCLERSIEMMVGLLAIQKAGGAYLPLDPTYPKDRIAYMVEDAKVPVLLTQERLRGDLPPHRATVIALDADWDSIIAKESAEPFDGGAEPRHLAYVIYTSGSTGKPKGVMVEHRNAVNFFAGMDDKLAPSQGATPGVWLAVTSLSFDISVLELCWTLTRGFKVVIATQEDRSTATPARGPHAARPIDFSLFYFSSDESGNSDNKYKLLLDGARYGDAHGFAAVWTPERHFHAFGGLYPNPAVTSAAIAAVTERIKIRAGSVVLPLHHPIRVAEDWSVVDNISRGRVGISFASGWQPNDFVLRPENFATNKQVMLRDIEVVRKLWRGEKVSFPGATGEPVDISILPRPVQKELPIWVTSAGNPETFAAAGRLGAHVLTHLLGQSIDELTDKLAAYRQAWKDAGHPGEGYVSLMLHTLVGPDEADVREKVRLPLIEYLRSSVSLIKQYAWSFPAFKKRDGMDTSAAGVDLQSLSDDEMTGLLEHSFNRYYETSGLFGTPEGCLAMVDRLKAIGVDDIACLIDFGIDAATVMEHLSHLNQLRKIATPRRAANGDHSLPALMQRHAVTHLQCTPSMARMLLLDDQAKAGLAQLQRMMIGGEAFPPSLAQELQSLLSNGEVMNMYGPTETTIWSAVHKVEQVDGIVPLGRPLVNQALYVLDTRQQPVPVGVPGELIIGGRGVVRGYLHRPDLTAERFIAHPVLGAAGGRVYRTGDLAKFRPDGTVEFLGRLDHQVKVRGYRIELGEIEAALLTHVAVRETVVVAREDVPGDLRLVAYFVVAGQQAPNVAELKEHLRDRLPDYMVPSHFVTLAALPQTPNGKVDRKALPAPDVALAPVVAAYVPPAGDTEQTIATVWKDVLNLPQVGTRDNFFDLGGHSLLAVQVHRKLRDVLQRELSITDIFRFPTIQSLSAYLSQDGADGAAAQQGKDRAEGRRAALQRRQVRPTAGQPRP
ncbi:MAG: MupA/Atu3671 family FMN-dependent luciferase-like monooxygenase [Pseudomonadota bacterium]